MKSAKVSFWALTGYHRLINLVDSGKSQSSADVAQLVEQLICNQQVGGSSPFVSSMTHGGGFCLRIHDHPGEVVDAGVLF